MINANAIQYIESKLFLMIDSGKKIGNITLMVCPESEIAELSVVETRYGLLRIEPGERIPKGYAYLIEKPLSRGGLGFLWIGKKQNSSPASVGERGQ